jgi:hypothetical protein
MSKLLEYYLCRCLQPFFIEYVCETVFSFCFVAIFFPFSRKFYSFNYISTLKEGPRGTHC